MSEIKRFKVEIVEYGYSCIDEDNQHGEYVTYEDHQAKIKELESQLEQAKKDARYITNMQQETRDNEESWYNCGEL